MQVVYFDQNAASELAKANPDSIWYEIRESLVCGFRDRKLICPLPFESVIETCPMSLEKRQAIQALFWQLSQGEAFKPFTEMSNELTLGLIRPASDWSPFKKWEPRWAEFENMARNITSDSKAGKRRMEERMSTFVQSAEVETMSEQELFHVVAAKRSHWVCDDLDYLLAGQLTNSSVNHPGLLDIDYFTAAHLSPAEIVALKRAVQHHGWAKIHIHALEIRLYFPRSNGHSRS